MSNKILCNNCENYGHLFYNCKRPITSLGIICFRKNITNNSIEYLLIKRKDSLGYVDFLRGKYNENNYFHINNIVKEMTDYEINKILNRSYDDLWDELWNKKNEPYDNKNKNKMIYVLQQYKSVFNKTIWKEPEWGFPKGRRNYKEKDIECALREFTEETGYPNKFLKIINNLFMIEENFTGSNLKSYKHRYFICKMSYHDSLYKAKFQESEIGDMRWVSYEECSNLIRYYNSEKLDILNRVNDLLNKYNYLI